MSPIEQLLLDGPRPVAVGAHDFAEALRAQSVEVVEVDWRPPQPPTHGPDAAAFPGQAAIAEAIPRGGAAR